MIGITDKDPTVYMLFFKMAFETKRRVPIDQHLAVHRSMRRVTGYTALAHSFVFEHEWATLGGMTFEACLIGAEESHSSAAEVLMEGGAASGDRLAFVRIVAIRAAHLIFEHRMVMRQLEFSAHFKVALETSLRITMRIDDCAPAAARFHVFATRAVTRFAPHFLGIVASGR